MDDKTKLRKINVHVDAAAEVLFIYFDDDKNSVNYDKLFILFVQVLLDIKRIIEND